jgi:hypothetical protein
MPHHWTPVEPGNPDWEKKVRELLDIYGDDLKYVGSAGRECWILYDDAERSDEEIKELEDRALAKPDDCKRVLQDHYKKC